MTTFDKLISIKKKHRTGFIVLIDPDRKSPSQLFRFAKTMESAGADAFLIGSSVMLSNEFDKAVKTVKKVTKLPLVIFPNGSSMLSSHADAILFCSLLSGRNPDYLIGEHVKAAPVIKAMKLETIPTAYLLIESGRLTAVSYMSHTMPIPRDKPEIAKAHALAAQYLGMKMVYLEAGSGAEQPVPIDMVEEVVKYIDLPVMVGGGITDSSYAHLLAKAGASFIVIGNALENDSQGYHAQEFAHAIHGEKKK